EPREALLRVRLRVEDAAAAARQRERERSADGGAAGAALSAENDQPLASQIAHARRARRVASRRNRVKRVPRHAVRRMLCRVHGEKDRRWLRGTLPMVAVLLVGLVFLLWRCG